MKLIAQGAEAEIFSRDDSIIKKRIKKDYRIKEIDIPLRKFRTKRETKVIEKLLSLGLCAPSVKNIDLGNMNLEMDYIKGIKARDKLNNSNFDKLCKEIGRYVGVMHSNGIIHGDLTTSNMIFCNKDKKIYFIDFGLSFFSVKVEDMAVDIHLFRQALESKHNQIWEKAFKSFLQGYKSKACRYSEIMKRFEAVESRGRNKGKS